MRTQTLLTREEELALMSELNGPYIPLKDPGQRGRSYNPRNQAHRQELATEIMGRLVSQGFEMEDSYGEFVYTKSVGRFIIKVYTTIVSERGVVEVRAVGEDAIRCVLLYCNEAGDIKPAAKQRKVLRTGTIEGVVYRVDSRVNQTVQQVDNHPRCHCGGPLVKSKADNNYCAEICWEKSAPAQPQEVFEVETMFDLTVGRGGYDNDQFRVIAVLLQSNDGGKHWSEAKTWGHCCKYRYAKNGLTPEQRCHELLEEMKDDTRLDAAHVDSSVHWTLLSSKT